MSSSQHSCESAEPPLRSPSLQDILDARAEALARPLSAETLASETFELLTFAVGQEQFAVDTRFVTEVIHDVNIIPLPVKHGALIGVTNLRGDVLAVMSLSGVLPLAKPSSPTPAGRWVIVLGTDHPRFGIDALAVTEVVAVPHGSILDSSPGTQINESLVVRGVTPDARIFLDGQALLDDERFVIDEAEA